MAKKLGRGKVGEPEARYSKIIPKPRVPEGFPLSWHKRMGKFYKTVAGKKHYFGSSPVEALRQWDKCVADGTLVRWQMGLDVLDEPDVFTVRDLAERYVDHVSKRFKAEAFSMNTYTDYRSAADLLVSRLGKQPVDALNPDHFTDLRMVLRQRGASTERKMIACIRGIFEFGARRRDCPIGFIDMGRDFTVPSPARLLARPDRPSFLLEAKAIRAAIAAASPLFRACVLLGINCGFYAKDCSDLLTSDVRGDWIINVRRKKLTSRICWLWPETREALRVTRAPENSWNRVLLSDAGGLLRVDRKRVLVECPHCQHSQIEILGDVRCAQCRREIPQADLLILKAMPARKDLVSNAWTRIRKKIGLTGPHRGFKCLRHTCNTVGRRADDEEALRLMMGHMNSFNITDVYDHDHVTQDRVRAVSSYIRDWLLAEVDVA